MKPYYIEQSLIYKGFINGYWDENGAFNKYLSYRSTKRFEQYNPTKSKNSSRYNILGDTPLCDYDKQYMSIPRKFLFPLKRINLLEFRSMHKTQLKAMIECARRYKKMCTDYYLPIYDLPLYNLEK